MEVWIDDENENAGPAGDRLDRPVEAAVPVRLRVVLDGDEELVGIDLALHGRSSAAAMPSFAPPTFARSNPPNQDVTWVTADWGGGRTLAKVTLRSSNPDAKQTVQLKIARGQSGWYSPPGPHSLALVANQNIVVSLPDTIADRLMVELMVDGAPSPCKLETCDVEFGGAARNPSVALAGERPLFEHAGVIATGTSVSVEGLLESLQSRLPTPLRNQSFTLELGAAAAGLLGLAWNLTVERVLEHFDAIAGQQSTLTLALDWSTPTRHVLPISATAVVHGLRLAARWTPIDERAVLGPDMTNPSRGVAGLLRPRYEQAQGFSFVPTGPLTGIDLWVRAPAQGLALELSLTIVEDRGGVPDAAALATVAISLAADGHSLGPTPSWLRIDLAKPLALTVERWWIVVRVDAGELAWMWAGPRPTDVSAPRYRRDGGAWLDREVEDPDAWAMTRLRALDPTPAPAPKLELLVDETPHELRASANDPTVFELPPSAATPSGASVVLRATSDVAGQLELGALDLRWREPTP